MSKTNLMLPAAVLVAVFCSAASADDVWPVPDWQVAASPEMENCSSLKLAEYGSWLEATAGGYPYGTVIIRHGKIVYEKYGGGGGVDHKSDVGSIRKSISSALLGMAVQEKKLTLDTVVYNVWPDIHTLTSMEKDKKILMKHLATMTSGWYRTENPGEEWSYNNAACTAGHATIGRVYGLSQDRVAPMVENRIQDVIGATSWNCWHEDRQFGGGAWNPGPSLKVSSAMRDLARYGYMWLREGEWNGKQVIPVSYVQEARSNKVASFDRNYGYWWFTNENQETLATAPVDAFWHCGNGTNDRRTILLVIPSLDLVAVVTTDARKYDINRLFASKPAGNVSDWASRFLPAILPDPGTNHNPLCINETFADDTVGTLEQVWGGAGDARVATGGLEVNGHAIWKLPGRKYEDQTLMISVAAGMPKYARVGVVVRADREFVSGWISEGTHTYLFVRREDDQGTGSLLLYVVGQKMRTIPLKNTNLANQAFLLRVVTSGDRILAHVNGEKVLEYAGIPDPAGGGYTSIEGDRSLSASGVIRMEYFLTHETRDLTDITIDRNATLWLTLSNPGLWNQFKPDRFFLFHNDQPVGIARFSILLAAYPSLWVVEGISNDHVTLGIPGLGGGIEGTRWGLLYDGSLEGERIP